MTPEELMKPRYKVIADYPDNKNAVGSIIGITQAGTKDAANLVCGWYDRFPAIYKRLEWWEERKIEEMPEYVKSSVSGRVFKVRHWLQDGDFVTEIGKNSIRNKIPATREEYEQYKQKEVNNE